MLIHTSPDRAVSRARVMGFGKSMLEQLSSLNLRFRRFSPGALAASTPVLPEIRQRPQTPLGPSSLREWPLT
jgi:hypothetical protein